MNVISIFCFIAVILNVASCEATGFNPAQQSITIVCLVLGIAFIFIKQDSIDG
jgi:hypothetical protein